MSRRFRTRLLLAAALLTSAVGAGVAYANGSSVVDISVSTLLPSEAPGMLGPISAQGRVGWACKPERAASARRWIDGELPGDSSK